MQEATLNLGLIDLISEKHIELRNRLHETNGQPVNRSEAHILAVLKLNGVLTISEIGRFISMSRQGTHKHIQVLLAAGLVKTVQVEGKVRDKYIGLTEEGYAVRDRLEETMEQLEQQIAERLGRSQVELLKELLREPWLG